MTKLQELQFKLSEVRTRLATSTDEDQEPILKEYAALETEYRKALEASAVEDTSVDDETEDTSETTEYRSLVGQANVGRYFHSIVKGEEVDGVEAELQQHHELASNQIPIDVIAYTPEVEERAVTPGATTAGLNQMAIEPPVFPEMQAGFLGIPMPRVPVGTPLYPDLTTRATVEGPLTDSTEVDETTGAFSTVTIAPARFQASYFYLRTEAARFAGMGEALRGNLSQALADALDDYIITQLTGSTSITDASDPTRALTYAQSVQQFVYGRIDGQWATMPSNVRHLVNTGTYAQLSTLYQNTARDNALEKIMQVSGGIRVSAHIAAASSNISTGIARLGNRRDAVAPVWEGVTIINDEVTKAATGEIVITAVMLANFSVLRTGGFFLTKTYQ